MEFKPFALRRPESREHFLKAFEISKSSNDQTPYDQMFGQLTRDQKADNEVALLALSPIVAGLVLEKHFEPEVLTEKALRRLLGKIFDALFPTSE